MDKAMGNIMDMLCEELDAISEKGTLSAGDLETLHKLVITKEKLLRIDELEENLGYSNSGEWNAEGRYSREAYGDSYGRHYVRGHYSRRGGRYSMAEGKDMIIDKIRDLMDDPNINPADRASLKRAMEQLQR